MKMQYSNCMMWKCKTHRQWRPSTTYGACSCQCSNAICSSIMNVNCRLSTYTHFMTRTWLLWSLILKHTLQLSVVSSLLQVRPKCLKMRPVLQFRVLYFYVLHFHVLYFQRPPVLLGSVQGGPEHLSLHWSAITSLIFKIESKNVTVKQIYLRIQKL